MVFIFIDWDETFVHAGGVPEQCAVFSAAGKWVTDACDTGSYIPVCEAPYAISRAGKTVTSAADCSLLRAKASLTQLFCFYFLLGQPASAGCYLDSSHPQDRQFIPLNNTETVDDCLNQCQDYGYPFAAFNSYG